MRWILIALSLAGTALASDYPDVDRAQGYSNAAQTALSSWDKVCGSSKFAAADIAMGQVESLMASAYAEWDKAPPGGFNDRYYGEVVDLIVPIAQDGRFMIADAALAEKCLDDADRMYRFLVKAYTGRAYEAARERAKIGIDDVRAARN